MIHKVIDSLYRLDLGVDVGQKGNVFLVFVNTEAQDSILGLIGVFVVKKLFLGVCIDLGEPFPYSLRQKYSSEEAAAGELAVNDFVFGYLVLD